MIAFTDEYLAEAIDSDSMVALNSLVKEAFSSVDSETPGFQEWMKHFQFVHGELDSQKNLSLAELEQLYDVSLSKREDLFRLVYTLESFYCLVLRVIAARAIEPDAPFSWESTLPAYYENAGWQNYTWPSWYSSIDFSSILTDQAEPVFRVLTSKAIACDYDFIKTIHESIIPHSIRHSLGEFYTPKWLVQHVIDVAVANVSAPEQRTFMDPACGSGSFLLEVIRKYYVNKPDIFDRVFGLDINPLTVLAAKTNYILLSAQLRGPRTTATYIPIHTIDSITFGEESDSLFQEETRKPKELLNPVDVIVGNPPWVNWEYLSREYRIQTAHLWAKYNLFNHKGMSRIFVKEDISVLFTYAVLNKFLKDDGYLCFLLKESLLKASDQGKGFRSFSISPSSKRVEVLGVHDFADLKPFKGVSARTIAILLRKGRATSYPVQYKVWSKRTPQRNQLTASWNEVESSLTQRVLSAYPSDRSDLGSSWITVEAGEINATARVLGRNEYKARIGVFTGGLNSAYWVDILAKDHDNVLIKNLQARAKNKTEEIEQFIEREHLYPLVTGRDMRQWSFGYTHYILCPHTSTTKMYPLNNEAMGAYPLTSLYFERLREALVGRKGFTGFDKHIHDEYYYALQRIGEYTFAPYKVAWKFISKSFTTAVIEDVQDAWLGTKTALPSEKVAYVSFANRSEAYYLCGVLSSSPFRQAVESYMVGTQITPGIISKLRIPKYDSQNELVSRISLICQEGHRDGDVPDKIRMIDQLVDQLLG